MAKIQSSGHILTVKTKRRDQNTIKPLGKNYKSEGTEKSHKPRGIE